MKKLLYELAERWEHWQLCRRLIRYNLQKSAGIERQLTHRTLPGGLSLRVGEKSDLKAIDELQVTCLGSQLLPFMQGILKVRARELSSVLCDELGAIIGFELFMFHLGEAGHDIACSIYLGIAPPWRGQGLSSDLRRFSVDSFRGTALEGLSTLVGFDDVRALRSAQRAGYFITKSTVKPPGHYLYLPLNGVVPDLVRGVLPEEAEDSSATAPQA